MPGSPHQMEKVMIQPEQMPAPETLIDYGNGMVGAAMFHWATEGCSVEDIARAQGFDVRFLQLDNDANFAELADEISEGATDLCERWMPAIPQGWQLAAKMDGEDGPWAMFIRPEPKP